ncbi:ADR317Cp [Eremothecium gossypii ATCC 10895]|uniref:ADR317Cp n=1 Tax=Eremothecium gossypii (strain ATCC 10895 / CBS 109.51 / FGSC 9923 / NRRL Y-1056) TaxID=284811 RepID=Q759F9_EREGS|nr:ADR317Cp [Eremothecium gossypii ATCC 10895]AAS52237.2 ADR317Cp [Eremothecium gossypii ATCC 10895]AEY96536.1 FADR317Cp [Eremothecium gossypii FDAG1]
MRELGTSQQYLRPASSCSQSGSVNQLLRRPQLHLNSDSDDDHPLGPPKLSNFGSALLTDKENETPTYLRRSGTSLQGGNATATSGHTKPSTFTGTMNTEDSHSTLFSSMSKHQPSMTTVDAERTAPGDDGLSSHRYQVIQQSMKDEILSRQGTRRSRRFITSRLATLGPAKRNSTTTNFEFSSNISHDESRDVSHQEGNVSTSSNSNSGVLNNNGYNVFLDTEERARHDDKESHSAARQSGLSDYGNISFGDLNPYQYLKKHNLPTSELPNISRIYFEMQKRENRRAAVRKNVLNGSGGQVAQLPTNNSAIASTAVALKEANGIASISSGSNKLTPPQAANSMIKRDRQPRRKHSDASVSSFSKLLSSPISAGAPNYADSQKHTPVQKNSTPYEPLLINQNTKKREALNSLDVNANRHPSIITKKQKVDELHDYLKKAPAAASVKKVEIVEPVRDPVITTIPLKPPSAEVPANVHQLPQRKRQVITVNGSEYEKVELLGRGGSSKVYKVRNSSNRIYALKRVSFDEFDDASADGFKGEIELLKKLENQTRVVKLIDHEMNHGVLYVVMECGDHDLSQVLAQRSSMPLDIEFVRYHAQEMLKCVKVVHDAGIVHSDLKPANFVFVKGILKIIDFGIANAVPDHTVNIYRDTQIGTPNYMAPEALVAMNYTQDSDQIQQEMHHNRWKVGKPSDIWSCGCIMYQMIYGKPPYGSFQGQNRLLAIMNPEVKIVYPEKTPTGDFVPRTALDTIKACLERNPERRWTVDELLRGPFIKPITVTHFFIRDLIKNAVKYGSDQRYVSKEKVEDLADDVWHRLSDFRL